MNTACRFGLFFLFLLPLASCRAKAGDAEVNAQPPSQEGGQGLPRPGPVEREEEPVPDAAVPSPAGEDAVSEPALPPPATVADFDAGRAAVDPLRTLREAGFFWEKSYHESSSLYVVGFSPDGKMAFMRLTSWDGTGTTEASLHVQDLVSDEILWSIASPPSDEYDISEGRVLMGRFLADNRTLVDGKLAEYGIRAAGWEFDGFPYTAADGRTFTASLEAEDTGENWNDMDWYAITSYSCLVEDGGGRRKAIVSGRELAGPEAFVCGCIKNPFEDRLAVIIAEARYGFEGCDLAYSICGCDMHKGF